MNSTSSLARAPWFAAFIAAATFSPLSAETTDTISKSFDVTPGTRLEVDIDVGGIEVRGGAGSKVEIEYLRKVSAESAEIEERLLREHVVTIEQTGDTVRIHARGPRHNGGGSWWRSLFGGGTNRRFHLKVTVPEQFNVDLKTSGGGIDVARLTGDVKANTSGGGLDFADITGDINGHTSGGGIDLDRCKGTVDVNTSGGGIRAADGEGQLAVSTSGGGITIRTHLGNVKADTSGGGITCSGIAGDVQAHTSGGGVRADLTQQPKGECRLSTSGGGVTVTLPADVAVNLDAETSGGGVNCDLPVTVTGKHKRDSMRGTINGGGPLVHLRSSGGSIHVNRGPAAGVAAVER
jgi:DUF4097 and DUF4098 domain-containing protein YvlB